MISDESEAHDTQCSHITTTPMPQFTEISTSNPSGQYTTVAMGDVNKDGIAELLSGGHEHGGGSPTGLYLWQYSGSTWNRQTINSTGSYGEVALCDVTNDGILDAVGTISEIGVGMHIFKGSYSGATISFDELTSPFTYSSTDGLAIGDINKDGHNDIVMGTWWAGIQILVNDGNNPPSWTNISIPYITETTGVALADVNNDSKKDIVAAHWLSSNATVYLCTGINPITYDNGHSNGLDIGPNAFGVAVSDFNDDGKKDLVIAADSGLKVFLGNNCYGTESTWWTPSLVTDSSTPYRMQVSVGDINKDSYKDIIYASGSGVVILQNDGTGKFSRQIPTGLPASGTYSGCYLYDWDGDGDLDIAACGWGNGVHFYRNDLTCVPEISNILLVLIITSILLIAVWARKMRVSDT